MTMSEPRGSPSSNRAAAARTSVRLRKRLALGAGALKIVLASSDSLGQTPLDPVKDLPATSSVAVGRSDMKQAY